jgi:hypothetical protein
MFASSARSPRHWFLPLSRRASYLSWNCRFAAQFPGNRLGIAGSVLIEWP